MTFTRREIMALAREAGFRTGHIDLTVGDPVPFIAPASGTSCIVEVERFAALVAEKAAAKERESLLVEMRSGEVQLPIQVAARWPSVPGSHKYAGAGGCQPGSFGPDSEDLFTTAQLLDYGDRRAAAEREACAQVCDAKAHEVRLWCNESNVIACAAAIRARGEEEGA